LIQSSSSSSPWMTYPHMHTIRSATANQNLVLRALL
jgi:hypothetical protein